MEYLSGLMDSIPGNLGNYILRVVIGIAILVAGWFVALIIRAAVRRGLGFLKINERVGTTTEKKVDLEGGVSLGAYYLILVMAFIAFFNYLGLHLVSEPLQSLVDKVANFLPNLVAGGLLAVVAWILATLVKKLALTALHRTEIDDKLTKHAGMKPVSRSVADILYWLIVLLFLPMILDALKLHGMLEPVRGMMDKTLAMLPNVFAAAVIGFVGWFLANILRNLVVNLLSATGADKLGESAGLRGTMPLSKLVGLIVFVFVFVPALIAALNALRIDAIADPATSMLEEMMAAIPNIFSAGLILAVAWIVSGFVASVITSLLGGMGFDNLPARLGVKALPEGTNLSSFVGKVIVFFVMLFATVESANMLGFTQVSNLVGMMIEFGGDVLLGVAIICVGLWIANLAHGAISRQAGSNAAFFAGLARVAILGIVFAMGLNAMNLADEVVNGAFLLAVGAVAVAIALSFGLGGREAAGRQMEHWLGRFRNNS